MNPAPDFHPDANAEVEEATRWYRSHSEAAADRFEHAFVEAVEKVVASPQRWPQYLLGTRRYLVRRYPYLVIYRQRHNGTIQIVAIAHGHRKPAYWKDRLNDDT